MNPRRLGAILAYGLAVALTTGCGSSATARSPLRYLRCDPYAGPTVSARQHVAQQGARMRFRESLPRSVTDAWGGAGIDPASGADRWYVTTPAAKRELDARLRRHPELQVTTCLVPHTRKQVERTMSLLSHRIRDHGLVVTSIAMPGDQRLVVGVPANAKTFEAHATGMEPAADGYRDNASRVAAVVEHLVDRTRIEIDQRKTYEPEIATAS